MPNCPLTLRLIKGSKLTFAELDNNFLSLAGCIDTLQSNIYGNFLNLTGGTLTGPLTACTGIYTDELHSCNDMLTVWSDITINGDVTINGSATTINTEVIQSQDNSIVLNYSGTHLTAISGGIIVEDGQSDGVDSSILTDTNGNWVFTPGISSSTLSACTGIWTSNLYGCSPITVHDNIQSVGSLATGLTSFAFGYITSAFGNYSHSEGYQTTSSGNYSHAEGTNTIAQGNNSHAEGGQTTASGYYSHAEGYQTIASNTNSHAEGQSTTASGYGSHAEGLDTTSDGQYSHAEGNLTFTLGNASHAEGFQTTASGNYSHAEGRETRASGIVSHAEGYYTTASGTYSHSEGFQTSATTQGSHSEGYMTLTTGDYSHAEGKQTTASGYYSHAEGNLTKSIGQFSHAEGRETTAGGDYSHTEGIGTVTSGQYQHVQGLWNVTGDTTQGAFIIGNGSNASNRSNLIFAAGNEVNISGKTITTNFQMTSGATAGYTMISDANGNATWQPLPVSSGRFGIADSGGTYTYYSTLSLAMSAATAGQTIEQFADVNETGNVTISWKTGVNFNGNNHTYTHSYSSGDSNTINLPTAITATISNWRVIRSGRANGTSTDYIFTVTDTGFGNNASVITFNNVYMESTYGTAVYLSMGGGLYQGSLYGKGYLYGVFAHSEVRGVTGESTWASPGFYIGNSQSLYNCIGISLSGYGIQNNGGIRMVQCFGRSTSNVGLYGGYQYNCVGISTSGPGGFGHSYNSTYVSVSGVAGDGIQGSNNTLISSSSYGWYTFFPGYKLINSSIVSTSNVAAVTRGSILKNCVIRSEYNNSAGHAISEWFNDSVSKIISCDLEVTNSSANCINSSAGVLNIKIANCTYDGATTPVGSNITQTLSNTQDNQGNIVL